MISKDVLILLVVVGAAGVALWCDLRLSRFRPTRRSVLCVQAVCALALLQAAPALTSAASGPQSSATRATVALLGIFFPALAYVFLNALWLLRAVQRVVVRT